MTQKQQNHQTGRDLWGIRAKLSVDSWLLSRWDTATLCPVKYNFSGIEPPEWQINHLPTEQDWELRGKFTLTKGKKAEEHNPPSSAGL